MTGRAVPPDRPPAGPAYCPTWGVPPATSPCYCCSLGYNTMNTMHRYGPVGVPGATGLDRARRRESSVPRLSVGLVKQLTQKLICQLSVAHGCVNNVARQSGDARYPVRRRQRAGFPLPPDRREARTQLGWPIPEPVGRRRRRRDSKDQTTHVETLSEPSRDGGSIPPASNCLLHSKGLVDFYSDFY